MARPTDSSKPRGELGEIRTTLAGLSSSGNKPEALIPKREVFKKIINYMTVGIDMSSLFMQAMTCAVSHADDKVLKKMLYQYICTYAQSNPDLTLLTINLLTKDCRDQDPHVRGLALRSLCSLRVANLVEYLVPPRSCICSAWTLEFVGNTGWTAGISASVLLLGHSTQCNFLQTRPDCLAQPMCHGTTPLACAGAGHQPGTP